MADRITVGFAVVLAALYLYATEQFPALQIGDPLGPKAFPHLLGVGLLVSAAALLVETLRVARPAGAGQTGNASGRRRDHLVLAAIVAWTVVYIGVFERLGYALSTSVYLLALIAYFHRRNWTATVLTPVLFSFASYGLFTRLLGVSLPRGLLPF